MLCKKATLADCLLFLVVLFIGWNMVLLFYEFQVLCFLVFCDIKYIVTCL